MNFANNFAQFRAWWQGTARMVLNAGKPNAMCVHIVPPEWRLSAGTPHIAVLNGRHPIPLESSRALLLRYFAMELDRQGDDNPGDEAIEKAVREAVRRTNKIGSGLTEEARARDLGNLLAELSDVARGKTPPEKMGEFSAREYAVHMRAPHRAELQINAPRDLHGKRVCTLKCHHIHSSGGRAVSGKPLTTEEWKKVIGRCRSAGIPRLIFTGGEPARQPDLAELIACAKWFVTELHTDGTLLTPSLCGQLRDAGLDSVRITLYSGDCAVHDHLAGETGAWEKTVCGLKNAMKSGLDVTVSTPLCAENMDYSATLEFLLGKGVEKASCWKMADLDPPEDGMLSVKNELSVNVLSGVVAAAAVFCKINGMELSFLSPGQLDPDLLQRLEIPVPRCGACLSHMLVAPDGSVLPCHDWAAGENGPGSILQKSWRAIWNHPICQSLRNMDEDETAPGPR